jgi:hypothetical protein
VSLYDIFNAIEQSPLGTGIKESTWLFPGIEAVHLLALAMLGGAVLMLDLRLLGVGLTSEPASVIERNARPWMIGALVMIIATGLLIASSEMLKLYDKPAFWVKMTALLLAIGFTFAVHNPMASRDPNGWRARGLGIGSLALWLTVAIAGRWIGFS